MLLSWILAASLTTPSLKTKVIGASLFKNGYAVVMREADLGGSGERILDEMPNATLGTLWITASPGVKFKSVVATSVPTSTESPVASLDEVLQANIGKDLTFKLATTPDQLIGKLLSFAGDTAIVQADKKTLALTRGLIMVVSSEEGLQWKRTVAGKKPAYRFDTEGPANGKLYILSLERGLTWAPAYMVDISDEKNLTITAKATIIDELVDFKDLEVRLITGFPNVPFVSVLDPFSISVSFDQFTGGLMNLGTPDAMRRSGGFGGQMMQNAAPMESSFDSAFNVSQLPGMQSEDLFFYRQPGVTLNKGDRGYYILFKAESDFEHIYEWNVADQVVDNAYRPNPEVPQNEVWHSLKFKNNSKQPWTTAPAMTVKDGQILGQDSLTYTTAGSETVLKITKALDVKAEASEEEVSRDKDFKQIAGYNYIEVTLKGTLRVRNMKSEAIKLRVKKELSGTVVSSTGSPDVKAIPKGLRSINPTQCLTWEVSLKPGDKQDLNYTYKVLIRP